MSGTEDLEELDIAVDPADAPCGRGPEPVGLASGDAVPLFRADLRVARGASPGLFEVSDPASGKSFTLYEFELAVARMLDGRRRASAVIASGARLGVPIDLSGLNKFVRQMWHYGFLADPGAEAAEGAGEGTWPARESWDEATRTLYQTGLRLMRAGRPADAASYFEAMLDAHPANAEATEMLALIARGQSLAASPLGGVPGAPRRAGRRIALAAAVVLALAGGAAALLLRPAAPPPRAPAVAAPTPPPAPPPAPPPPPRWRSAPVLTRRHPTLGEIVSPDAGAVRWHRPAGAALRKGEKVGELRVPAGGAPRPELARRIAELERLAGQDPVYRDFLAKARREARRAARGRARAVPLVAPAAGALAVAPEAPPRAERGTVLARVVDPAAWHLGFALSGEPPPAGAACEVVGDAAAERAPCRIAAASAEETIAEVSAADAPWIGRAESPFVRLPPEGAGATAP